MIATAVSVNRGVNGLVLRAVTRGYRVVLCVPDGYSKEKIATLIPDKSMLRSVYAKSLRRVREDAETPNPTDGEVPSVPITVGGTETVGVEKTS